MENYEPSSFKRLYIASLLLAVLIVYLTCTGCNFFRKLDSSNSKQSTEKKNDTANVHKSEVDSKKTGEYERNTFIPVVPNIHGDTNVFNINIPKQPQPYVIIQEKGKYSEQVKSFNYDSAYAAKLEKILEEQSQKKTETEIKVLPIGFWIGVAIVGIVIIAILIMLNRMSNLLTKLK